MNISDYKIGFIGLGYAGFPMACLFSKKYKVVGYDHSKRRVSELASGVDHCGDVSSEDIHDMLNSGALFTTDIENLRDCNFFIVVVPTPVDKNLDPDISFIDAASREVGSVLKKGDIVVFESTVFPGATENVCVPALEETSGLRLNEDFFVGYAPERINPGDKMHTPDNVVKVVSGSTPEAAEIINRLYASVLGDKNTYLASSIKVAEACKVVENAQRDLNIAFINEMAKILGKLDIDTNEVVDAMNTKWNALNFRPGLVGGHCISVDPYYLVACAKKNGANAELISSARRINNSMAEFIASSVAQNLEKNADGSADRQRILLLGFTFKENCPDVRNSKVFDIYTALKCDSRKIDIFDPWADGELVKNLYRIAISTNLAQIDCNKYDAIILCVAHNDFRDFDLAAHLKENGFVYDVKAFFPRTLDKSVNIKRI